MEPVKREVVFIITLKGEILIQGDDLPDDLPDLLEALVGPQESKGIALDINLHLCG